MRVNNKQTLRIDRNNYHILAYSYIIHHSKTIINKKRRLSFKISLLSTLKSLESNIIITKLLRVCQYSNVQYRNEPRISCRL